MLKRFIRPLLEMLGQTTRKRVAEEGVDAAAATANVESKKGRRKGKNVKYAVLLSYQGQNYFGMQYQRREKEFPTIESHLLRAMLAHGFINDEHMEDLFPWHFQRAARTDRYVSAVRQVCSMFLPMDQHFIDNGVKLLNSTLPEDIRVFGVRKVTPSFHAQKFCDGRTYSYTTPTFAFAPCDQLTTDQYRITEERVAEMQELFNCFIGTHNFYNYTSGLPHSDQRARRKILEFRCERPFLYMDPVRQREVEFIRIYIRGQSFILHQIRKMIGISMAILRGFLHKSDISRSFQDQRMDVPRAPGLGLLLERLHYNRFESRYLQSHGSLNDWGDELEKEIVAWRDQWIVQRILSEECRTQTMMMWLSSLPMHQYIVDPEDESGENVSALQKAANNAMNAAKGNLEIGVEVGNDGVNAEDRQIEREEEFEGGEVREEMNNEEIGDGIDGENGAKMHEEEVEKEEEEEKPKKMASM